MGKDIVWHWLHLLISVGHRAADVVFRYTPSGKIQQRASERRLKKKKIVSSVYIKYKMWRADDEHKGGLTKKRRHQWYEVNKGVDDMVSSLIETWY